MTLTIESPAFGSGQSIPIQYTGEGQNISPPLTWSGVPPTAQELALICDDPDAPTPEPWVHWVIYKIPASATGLPENIPPAPSPDTPTGIHQGVNTSGQAGYMGPMPPPGHGVHRYHFKLYALDTPLEATAEIDKDALLDMLSNHIVAQAQLIGTYQR